MGKKSIRNRSRSDIGVSKLRLAITNGTRMLADLDHRGAWARRLKDLIGGQVADLGGEEMVSEAEKVLVRRAAMLTLQLELMEQRFAANEAGEASPKQIETYQRCTNTLRRTLESLGLKRRAKDLTPTLEEYAAQRRQAEGTRN
jgi:hypothetical protein